MNYFFKLFLFFLVCSTNAQETKEPWTPFEPENRNLDIQYFSYPIFLNNKTHSSIVFGYKFDKKIMAELEGFYKSYSLSDIYGLNVRFKYYVNNDIYLFSGMGAQFERGSQNASTPVPRLYLINGIGYDVNEKLNLEAKHELQLNKSNCN